MHYATAKGYSCHHIKSTATLTWAPMKNYEKTPSSIGTVMEYALKMKPLLTSAWRQKRKQLKVYIVRLWHRNIDGVLTEAQKPPPPSFIAPSATQTLAALKVQKEIDKQARENREQAERDAQTVDKKRHLIQSHNCLKPRCPGYDGGQCYVYKNSHYKLTPDDFNK